MELDVAKVRETFALYSGENMEAQDDRAALCGRLCDECAARAQTQAKSGAEGYSAALESWAAAEAFYQLVLLDEASAPESVTADGVTLREGERSKKARALAEEKRRAALPALGEEAFYFGSA